MKEVILSCRWDCGFLCGVYLGVPSIEWPPPWLLVPGVPCQSSGNLPVFSVRSLGPWRGLWKTVKDIMFQGN